MKKAKSYCRSCGRALLYGWLEMCQQCDVRIDNSMRQEFRRKPNKFTRRPDIKKKYRL